MRIETIYDSLNEAFCRLRNAVHDSSEFLRIPRKANGDYRICEQEFKLFFINSLFHSINDPNFTVSIEDPTQYGYRFSSAHKILDIFDYCRRPDESGLKNYRSACIDVLLYEQGKRVAIIEFKAGNPGEFMHRKDFYKLDNEPGVDLLRLFVEVYGSSNNKTIDSIAYKLFRNNNYHISEKVIYRGYSLEHNGNTSGSLITYQFPNSLIVNNFTL